MIFGRQPAGDQARVTADLRRQQGSSGLGATAAATDRTGSSSARPTSKPSVGGSEGSGSLSTGRPTSEPVGGAGGASARALPKLAAVATKETFEQGMCAKECLLVRGRHHDTRCSAVFKGLSPGCRSECANSGFELRRVCRVAQCQWRLSTHSDPVSRFSAQWHHGQSPVRTSIRVCLLFVPSFGSWWTVWCAL